MGSPAQTAFQLLIGIGAGLACGAALARLYAPLRGEQIRAHIVGGGRSLRDLAEDRAVGTRDRLGLRLGQAQIRRRDALSQLRKEALNS